MPTDETPEEKRRRLSQLFLETRPSTDYMGRGALDLPLENPLNERTGVSPGDALRGFSAGAELPQEYTVGQRIVDSLVPGVPSFAAEAFFGDPMSTRSRAQDLTKDLKALDPVINRDPNKLDPPTDRTTQLEMGRMIPMPKYSGGASTKVLSETIEDLKKSKDKLAEDPGAMKRIIENEAEARERFQQEDLRLKLNDIENAEVVRKERDLSLQNELKEAQDRQKWIQEGVDQDFKLLKKQVNETEKPLDPNRIWKDKNGSTDYGRLIGATIATFITGVFEARAGRGGKNPARDIINRAISRDIDAQKTDTANRRFKLGQRSNLLSKMMEIYGTPQQAEQAVKVIMGQAYTNKLRGLETKNMGLKAKNNHSMALAEATANDSKELMKFGQMSEERQNKIALDRANVANQKARIDLENKKMVMAQESAFAKSQQQGEGLRIPGLQQVAPTDKDSIKKAREFSGQYQNLTGMIDDALATGVKGWKLLGTDVHASKALRASMVLAMIKLYKMGASFSVNEERLINESIPSDFTALQWTEIPGKLNKLKQILKNKAEAELGSLGFQLEKQQQKTKVSGSE